MIYESFDGGEDLEGTVHRLHERVSNRHEKAVLHVYVAKMHGLRAVVEQSIS